MEANKTRILIPLFISVLQLLRPDLASCLRDLGMHKQNAFPKNAPLRLAKICLTGFGIAAAAVLASGALQLGALDTRQKTDPASHFLRPLYDGLNQAAERLLYRGAVQ